MKATGPKTFSIITALSTCALLLAAPSVQADGRVRTWGKDSNCDHGTPTCLLDTSWLSNIVAVAAGSFNSLALTSDGRVLAWGDNADTNFASSLSNITAISASADAPMALTGDGEVIVPSWVAPTDGLAGLHGVAAIAAHNGFYDGINTANGGRSFFAVKSNGTVQAWGPGVSVFFFPIGLTNVAAVAAGAYHALALRKDGTVVAWPNASQLYGGRYGNYGQVDLPPGLTNIVAVAAGAYHSMALKSDGTVIAWGGNADIHAPPGLSNVVAIAAGDSQCLALKADGTVVEWVSMMYWLDIGQYIVPTDLSNVVAIAGSLTHNIALYSADPIIRRQPVTQSVMAGDMVSFSISATSPTPMTFQWRFNGTNLAGATNGTFSISNAQATNTGGYDVVVCSTYGCVTSAVATLAFKAVDVQILAAVTVQGVVGANTRVDWSADLHTWNTLTNFPLPYSPFRFADWGSVGQAHRYYRVVFVP